MLSNAYFLAKFRFDTAENEPAKNLQKFGDFPNFSVQTPTTVPASLRSGDRGEELRSRPGWTGRAELRALIWAGRVLTARGCGLVADRVSPA